MTYFGKIPRSTALRCRKVWLFIETSHWEIFRSDHFRIRSLSSNYRQNINKIEPHKHGSLLTLEDGKKMVVNVDTSDIHRLGLAIGNI